MNRGEKEAGKFEKKKKRNMAGIEDSYSESIATLCSVSYVSKG